MQLSVHPRRRAAALLGALKLGAQGAIMVNQPLKLRSRRKAACARAQPSDPSAGQPSRLPHPLRSPNRLQRVARHRGRVAGVRRPRTALLRAAYASGRARQPRRLRQPAAQARVGCRGRTSACAPPVDSPHLVRPFHRRAGPELREWRGYTARGWLRSLLCACGFVPAPTKRRCGGDSARMVGARA